MKNRLFEGDRDHVYEAANVWKETCLINDGTILFDNEAVWTIENLQLLKMRFTDNPQYDKDSSFDKKFELQLKGAPEAIYKLAMEVMYVYYLFPSYKSFRYKTKLSKINEIATWAGITYEEQLSDSYIELDNL